VLTPGKVRCSPCSHARSRCAWLLVAPLLLVRFAAQAPPLRTVDRALPGRDGKAGSLIEPESCEASAVFVAVGPLVANPRQGDFYLPAPGAGRPAARSDGLSTSATSRYRTAAGPTPQ
jgi:hypothetical protein